MKLRVLGCLGLAHVHRLGVCDIFRLGFPLRFGDPIGVDSALLMGWLVDGTVVVGATVMVVVVGLGQGESRKKAGDQK